MKTIVSTAIVLTLAVVPVSAASKHKRHTKPATAQQQQICLHPLSAASQFCAAAVQRRVTRHGGRQPALMWRHVRITRFMASAANPNGGDLSTGPVLFPAIASITFTALHNSPRALAAISSKGTNIALVALMRFFLGTRHG